jgi:orotidine-5'-phosphate decarboxylase
MTPTPDPYGDRLAAAVSARGPLCAGVDPSAALLADWGLPDDAAGLESFARITVEAFAPTVAAVKPQVAFFERHGPEGLAVLQRLVAEARRAGLLVVADAKRGDIGSTMEAYAEAWLGPASPFAPDAVTVLPYLGLGALDPAFAAAAATGRGVYVVLRTSNPEGRRVQTARTVDGPALEDALLGELAARNAAAGLGRGSFGAVVGATLEPSCFDLADLGGPVLAPGFGAQGAGPADVARRFARCPADLLLVNAARSLLASGPDPAALGAAAAALNAQLGATRV